MPEDEKPSLSLHADEEVKKMTLLNENNGEKAAQLSKELREDHLLGGCLSRNIVLPVPVHMIGTICNIFTRCWKQFASYQPMI